MTLESCRPLVVLSVAFAAALGVAASADAQQTQGVITGRVTDGAAGQPIRGARVYLVGTNTVQPTNEEGVYTLRNVAAGSQEVRVIALGFAEQKQTVQVDRGATITLNFVLSSVPIRLSEVVTTATGDQRRVEVGNSIGRIDAAEEVENKPVTTLGDLLTTRAVGVQVLPGNMSGSRPRVRIRGSNSLSLGNEPIYVIDGIRMESGSGGIGVGGTTNSRVNDLNPEEIESIEIVKGPSAATLYGTDAANGVIVITTKQGIAGAPQWQAYVERGWIRDLNDYPRSYSNAGRRVSDNAFRICDIPQLAAGTCVSDSLRSFSVYEDPETTPNATGERAQYGLQVSGGTAVVRYFMSAEHEGEIGPLQAPEVDVRRFRRLFNDPGYSIPDEQFRPVQLEKISLRANLTASLTPEADVAVQANYITSDHQFPQVDNNITGLGYNSMGGPGYKYNTTASGDSLYGYQLYTPGDIFQEHTQENLDRFIGSANADWRIRPWLAVRATAGVDYSGRVNTDLCRLEECADFSTSREGFKVNNRNTTHGYTFNTSGTASWQPLATLSSKTTFGAQYYQRDSWSNGANGSGLPPGATTVSQTATRGASESFGSNKTLGMFLEEALSWRDRLFVTLAVRGDDNSAFGKNYSAAYYPKASVSWVLSDEPFLAVPNWLGQLRLRSAWGASGTQPQSTAALAFFQTTTAVIDNTQVPALVFSTAGNPDLKPERATEFEVGADASLFDSRLSAELTYYHKKTKDAIIERRLPPSRGEASSRFENLGSVRNSGWEALLRAVPVEREAVTWDMSLSYSINDNELVSLGGVPPIVTSTSRQTEGYPLNSFWIRPIESWSDENGDGMITQDEVVVPDSAQFFGRSTPRYEAALFNAVSLFRGRLRLSASADYKGGHKVYNNTERIRCSQSVCRGRMDPSAPLWEQARVAALRDHPSRTVAGFIEDASFFRLREVSAVFELPEDLAARYVRSNRVSFVATARNLWRSTDYTGIDPEAGYGSGDFQLDLVTAPPPTYYTFRVIVGF